MTTIATICARGGSKGVPGKNIRRMLGRPLIAYTIEQALSCPLIDEVFVSTDSEEIAAVSVAEGASVLGLRPAHLATDDAPKLLAIQHLVETVEAARMVVDRIVDLDPTSPLRSAEDITACIKGLDDDTDVVITGYRSDKNPYFNMVEQKSDGWFGLVMDAGGEVSGRQQAPAVYAMNASIYCWWRRSLGRSLWGGHVRLHEMPRERSIDVDHPIDWDLVELLLQRRGVES